MDYYEYEIDLFETEKRIVYDKGNRMLHIGTILGQGASRCPFVVNDGLIYKDFPLPMCFHSYVGNGNAICDNEPCAFYQGVKIPHSIGNGLKVKCSLEDNRAL